MIMNLNKETETEVGHETVGDLDLNRNTEKDTSEIQEDSEPMRRYLGQSAPQRDASDVKDKVDPFKPRASLSRSPTRRPHDTVELVQRTEADVFIQ